MFTLFASVVDLSDCIVGKKYSDAMTVDIYWSPSLPSPSSFKVVSFLSGNRLRCPLVERNAQATLSRDITCVTMPIRTDSLSKRYVSFLFGRLALVRCIFLCLHFWTTRSNWLAQVPVKCHFTRSWITDSCSLYVFHFIWVIRHFYMEI